MRRISIGFVSVFFALLLVMSSATAQSTPEATLEELQERVAELEAENEELKEENERLRKRIEDMSGRTPRQGSGSGSETQETAPVLEIGETWSSDEWSITVTYVEITPSLLSSYETNTARGVYVIVHITVINEGVAPAAFPYRDLKLSDGDGRTYSVDDDSMFNLVYVVMEAGSIWDEMQPGLPYATGAIFDIPPTSTGLSLTTSQDIFVFKLD